MSFALSLLIVVAYGGGVAERGGGENEIETKEQTKRDVETGA